MSIIAIVNSDDKLLDKNFEILQNKFHIATGQIYQRFYKRNILIRALMEIEIALKFG